MMRWETTEPTLCPKKNNNDWRLISINVNNFPTEKDGSEKAKRDLLRAMVGTSEAEIIGMNEVGRNENKLTYQTRPSTIVKKWLERGSTMTTWNSRSSESSYEPGGVLIATQERATAHAVKKGTDKRSLGRWAWVTIRGKQENYTTIISAYRATNIQRTSTNQLNLLRKIHSSKEPEEFWFDDLSNLLQEKIEIGEIIVMGDFNSNLNEEDDKVNEFFRQWGMREIITEKYGTGPPTFKWGSTTIDGIYATSGITIRQGGYGGHGLSPTDHLYPWVDIEERMMVGEARDDRPPPLLRKATSKIPSVRTTFNDLLNDQINQHGLYKKAEAIYDHAVTNKTLTRHQIEEYESIEDRLRRSVKYADSKCRKARMGKVPYSAQQKKLLGTLHVLRAIFRRHKLKNSNSSRPSRKVIKRLVKKYSYSGPTHFPNKSAIQQALREAASAYNAFRPKAHELRDTYRSQLAHEISLESGRDPGKIYKEITHREDVREHFRRIKNKERRGERYGVDKIDVETHDGLRTVIDKKEIEEHIIRANKQKLLQAENTPLRTEPLRSIVGERMEYDEWERLLRGQIQLPTGMEAETRMWFEHIQNHEDKPMEISWSTIEYFDSWAKMSEEKSSMPGIQAAHLKSVDPSSDAAHVISWMAQIPLLTGYAPRSWKQGIDSMIPKKLNEWRPDKLRLILLMDARFNHNNKLIGRKMMEFGEREGYLAREQFGSRKEKSAIEHALNKRLTIDAARQSKTPVIYVANDAKSCYDRILLMVAYLTMRHMGISRSAATSSIDTLVNVERRVKTVYGVSEDSYSTDFLNDEILHGIGQGNGYGPIIWAGISSPLLQILRKLGHGVNITTPITNEKIQMAGYSFVDDTDLIEYDAKNTNIETTLRKAQRSLRIWESLLRTTGGALEPTKTDWVKIDYEWKNGRSKLAKADDNDELWVNNPEGIEMKLKQIEPSQARRTLGVWQAVDGNETKQTSVLLEKLHKWGANTTGILRKEAHTAIICTIGRTIRYPLAATALSPQQCKKVDIAMKREVLGKIGMVRTAPDQVIFTPVSMGGIGMHHTEIDQTIDQIKLILQHGHQNTVTGTLLRNTLENLAIESGLGGDPFDFNLTKINYLTENTWIERVLRNCKKYSIKIKSSVKGISKWTTTDEFLMERAIEKIEGQELRNFNRVRLFLQIATISDIATANGISVDKELFVGRPSQSPSPSKAAYQWPKVPPPSPAERRQWTESLCKVLDITRGDRILIDTHYRWFENEAKLHSQWNYNRVDSTIIQKGTEGNWRRWVPIPPEDRRATRRTAYFRRTDEMVTDLVLRQSQWIPITVQHDGEDLVSITSRGRYHHGNQQPRNQQEETWYCPQEYEHISNEAKHRYLQRIASDKGAIVADGSYKEGRSAAAFVIQHNHQHIIPADPDNYQAVTIPGGVSDQSSYRGELGGILAGIVFTNKAIENSEITTGTCEFLCDNIGALEASFGWKTPTPNWTCFDLISMIRYHLRRSPIRWTSRHIKGHQDQATIFQDLSDEAQANVIADREAKRQLNKNDIPIITDPRGGEPWTLSCHGVAIRGQVEKELRASMCRKASQIWWMNKLQVPATLSHTADWEMFTTVCRRTPSRLTLWAAKYRSDLLPTGKNLYRRKHSSTHACPCCGSPNETAKHIIQCQAPAMEETYQKGFATIAAYLQRTTSSQIRTDVLTLLTALRKGDNLERINVLTCAGQQQQLYGASSFLNGMWSKEWTSVHTNHTLHLGNTMSAETWLVRLSLHLQSLVRTMWETRNDAMHNQDDSHYNEHQHQELNQQIDNIYSKLPRSLRVFPRSDAAFFQRSKNRVKKYRLKRKEQWIEDATRIHEAFLGNLSPEAENFLDYFDGTA